MSREVMQMALDALSDTTQTLAWQQWDINLGYTDKIRSTSDAVYIAKEAIAALRTELAKPETKPVGWGHLGPHGWSYSHVKGVMHNVPLFPPTGAKP